MPALGKTESEKQNLAAPRVSLDSVLEFSRMSGDMGHGVHLCAWHAGPACVCTQQRVRRLPSTITTLGSERTNEVTGCSGDRNCVAVAQWAPPLVFYAFALFHIVGKGVSLPAPQKD